jgi:hypothetical protein
LKTTNYPNPPFLRQARRATARLKLDALARKPVPGEFHRGGRHEEELPATVTTALAH